MRIIPNARTATCIVILDQEGECAFIVGDMSVHESLTSKQVHENEDKIASAPMVIMDSNAPVPTINTILEMCSKHHVPVWFEPTDLSLAWKPFETSAWRSALSYASPNLHELRVMHDKVLGKRTPPLQDSTVNSKIEESLRLGAPLLEGSFHTLVVTLSSDGVLLVTKVPENVPFPTSFSTETKTDGIRAVHYPAPAPGPIANVSGAGDCLAAAMITAILQGLDQDACVAAGQKAAALSLASHLSVPDTMTPSSVFGSSRAARGESVVL